MMGRVESVRSRLALLALALTVALLTAPSAVSARETGDPIQLAWIEGDLAGLSRILSPDGRKTIGTIDYRQSRHDDVLEAVRVARFTDGSSDEDRAEARLGKTLETLRGRSIVRDARGTSRQRPRVHPRPTRTTKRPSS